MLGCGLVGSLMDIALPLFQRYSLDHFVQNKSLAGLGVFIAVYAVAIALAGAANYVSCAKATILEVTVNRDLRNRLFSHLQSLSLSYYNRNSVGYIHARLMSDTSRIGSLVSWTLMDAVWHSSYVIGAAIVMLIINARLALLVLAILPLIAVIFAFFQKRLIRVNREVREINSKITGNFNEGITGAKTVKSVGAIPFDTCIASSLKRVVSSSLPSMSL